jgi:hypothetical protein
MYFYFGSDEVWQKSAKARKAKKLGLDIVEKRYVQCG